MIRQTFMLDLTLVSPFIFPTLEPGDLLQDMHPMRRSQVLDGRETTQYLIPQDQLRGVFREALSKLAPHSNCLTADLIKDIFGVETGDVETETLKMDLDEEKPGFIAGRSRIFFTDAVSETVEGHPSQTATRVKIDEESGAAQDGGLFAINLAARPGQKMTFSASVELLIDKGEVDAWAKTLRAATTWISAIGGMKSAGYGRVAAMAVKEGSARPLLPTSHSTKPASVVTYELDIDRPFLVDADRAHGNVYLGREVIPGGVLKGALARKLGLEGRNVLRDASFTGLRISHARPKGMPPPLPNSLYVTEENDKNLKVYDAAQGADLPATRIRFSSDWKTKDREAAKKALGYCSGPKLARDVRMHVALKDGVAVEGKIYEACAVDPGEIKWVVEVDYRGCGDSAAIYASALADGLFGVGQTGAKVDFVEVEHESIAAIFTNAVMLKTDACIESQGAADAFTLYRDYWNRYDLDLKTFFAHQDIAGGYIGHRFKGSANYRPFLLTKAGAVFVFKEQEGLAEKLDQVSKTGIVPLNASGEAMTWQECPYQPENGYGDLIPLPQICGGSHD